MKFKTGISFLVILFIISAMNSPAFAQNSNVVQLDLQQALQRALDANSQFKASHFAFKKAAWDEKNAYTQMLPTLSFSSMFTRIDDRTFAERDFRRYLPPELANDIPQTVFQQSYFTALELSMPVFNPAVYNGIAIAKEGKKMAGAMKESTRQNTLFLVISSYLNNLKASEVLKLQKKYAELSTLNYEKAERLYNAGRYSNAEVLRWKVEQQQQKGVVVNSESELRGAKMDLKRLLNFKMEQQIELEKRIPDKLQAESDKLTVLSEADLLKMIHLTDDQLVKVNAALQAAKSDARMSKLRYEDAVSAYLPNVSLSYSYAWRENNTLALDDYSPTTLRVNLSVPLFTSFKNYSSAKSAHYSRLQSQENYEDRLQNTRYVLTQTINSLLNLKTQREISRVNVEYNERNYRVVEGQREQGLISNIDFIDAKLNLQNAQITDVNNHYDFISAMVELYYLLGKLDEII